MATKRGVGSDIFFQGAGQPIKKSKGGRPKLATEPTVKVSFWIPKRYVADLEEMKNTERSRLAAAGKEFKRVTVTGYLVEAVRDYLTKRKKR